MVRDESERQRPESSCPGEGFGGAKGEKEDKKQGPGPRFCEDLFHRVIAVLALNLSVRRWAGVSVQDIEAI